MIMKELEEFVVHAAAFHGEGKRESFFKIKFTRAGKISAGVKGETFRGQRHFFYDALECGFDNLRINHERNLL